MRPSPLLTLVPWLTLGACAASAPASAPLTAPAATSASGSALVSASASASGAGEPTTAGAASAESVIDGSGEGLPPGFVRMDPDRRTRCGEFVVEHRVERESGPPVVVVQDAHGRVVYQQQGTRLGDQGASDDLRMLLSADYCGDLTGDGVPELVMSESGGGAQCCENSHVVSLTSPARRLLSLNKGKVSTTLMPVKYQPGAAWQLETRVHVSVTTEPTYKGQKEPLSMGMPYFVVPLVLSLRQGHYELSSESSPEAFRKDRAAIIEDCRGNANCEGLIVAWLDSLVLDDWKSEGRRPIYKPWQPSLDRLAPRMQRELRERFKQEAAWIHKSNLP